MYGRATTPEVDTDHQIIPSEFGGKELTAGGDRAGAAGAAQGQRDPAGYGVKVEVNRDGDGAHWVKGGVDEPVAQRLVRKGHLQAYSVGIQAPVIERDLTGKAKGGIITGGRSLRLPWSTPPRTGRVSGDGQGRQERQRGMDRRADRP